MQISVAKRHRLAESGNQRHLAAQIEEKRTEEITLCERRLRELFRRRSVRRGISW